MTLPQAFLIAIKNVGGEMRTSAIFSLNQASKSMDEGDYDRAWWWILKSLQYSVGVFHNDYSYVKNAYEIESSEF